MKLIIDIPEMAYEAFKEWHKNKVATVEQSLIANGQPYEERPQGEWIMQEGYDGDEYYECSICKDAFTLMYGTPKDNNYNFCPNCGAKMKGGAE